LQTAARLSASHITSGLGVELHLLGFHDVWPHPRCVKEWLGHQEDDAMLPPPTDDFPEVARQLAEALADG
jgi:hypothetical protein